MKLDKEYWAAKYRENKTGWDLGSVSPPLKQYIDQLKDKSINILLPGAGNSYEAEYLHINGFKNIYVLDIAEEPLKNLKRRIPGFPEKNLIQADFFKFEESFDLILEQTFFCALPVQKRSLYAKKMHQLLRKNGKLVGLLFNFKFSFFLFVSNYQHIRNFFNLRSPNLVANFFISRIQMNSESFLLKYFSNTLGKFSMSVGYRD